MNNLKGARSGRLTAIRPAGKSKDGHILWVCWCSCGGKKIAQSNSILAKSVRSCGCLRSAAQKKRIRRDGVWNDGKSYAINGGRRCYKTRHSWAKAVIRKFGNRCQSCGWNKGRCDADHIVEKSAGGLHTIENGRVLCPNCHRLRHEAASR